jgi:hypothetical protein
MGLLQRGQSSFAFWICSLHVLQQHLCKQGLKMTSGFSSKQTQHSSRGKKFIATTTTKTQKILFINQNKKSMRPRTH